jgi:pectate lyase
MGGREPTRCAHAVLATLFVVASLSAGVDAQAGRSRVDATGFPVYGAAGETATGGYGRPRVVITNTQDSGAGSLREAVKCPGGCTISCAGLSGTIRLQSEIFIVQSNITIDCSDARSPGVQITGEAYPGGALLDVGADNVVLRYLRVRGAAKTCGPANNEQCQLVDMINLEDGTDDVVIDHVSLTGGTDGLLDIPGSHARVTVQNSILSRPAYTGYDTKLAVSLMGATNGARLTGVAWHRNIISTYGDRAPSLQVDSALASDVMLVENVFYDFVYAARMAQQDVRGSLFVDAVRNVFKRGPGGRVTPFASQYEKLPLYVKDIYNHGKVFVAGENALMDNGSRLWSQLWGVTYGPFDAFAIETSSQPNGIPTTTCGAAPCAQRTALTSRYWLYPTPTISATTVVTQVLATAGASLPVRDTLDADIVRDVSTGTRSVAFPPGNPVLPSY